MPTNMPRPGIPGPVGLGGYPGGIPGGYPGGGYGFTPPFVAPAPTYSGNFMGPGFAPYSNGDGAYNTTVSPYLNTLFAQTEQAENVFQGIAAMNNGGNGGPLYDPNIQFYNQTIAPMLQNSSSVYRSAMQALDKAPPPADKK